jgi:hypothetical protein
VNLKYEPKERTSSENLKWESKLKIENLKW